jgi:hypothetical protein
VRILEYRPYTARFERMWCHPMVPSVWCYARPSTSIWRPTVTAATRAFANLASIIETCRKRSVSPWPYLAEVLRQRRQGLPAPVLPGPDRPSSMLCLNPTTPVGG